MLAIVNSQEFRVHTCGYRIQQLSSSGIWTNSSCTAAVYNNQESAGLYKYFMCNV